MRLLHHLGELAPATRPVCAAVGMFDGVHLGHQHIIAEAVSAARASGGLALIITFDRHPASVVAPERAPLLLQPLSARLATLDPLGADALWLIHFDEAFSRKTGEDFIRDLTRDAAPLRCICVGENFHFGYQRGGNAARLQEWGQALGFEVVAAAPVRYDDLPISSTRVREAVRRGDFATAGRLLGRPYELRAQVVAGDQIGRQLGFPTANQDIAGLVLPPNGVYATKVLVRGVEREGVTNLGLRPTLENPRPTLHAETHLLDFDGDLYGREIGVRFVARLRNEQRFGSLEDLRVQIGRDIALARSVLAT